MVDLEKLGLFYLGRRYAPDAGAADPAEPLLYDSRDLVTHALCVGMTGSGKTGLCIGLVEEAAIDGIPVLAIDPKGDLANLCLTFPGLSAAEFRPWIDEHEARLAGLTPDAYAEAEARRWREGLAEWGQDGSRIERLRRAADITVYTPGSASGQPVSILRSFAAPPPAERDDAEALAERAGNTASSVLALAGAESALRSREHTLVASLFADAWRGGRDLPLAELIRAVQSPPFSTVGVVDLEAFYPEKDRFALAMQLNTLLAAPGFEAWLEGDPLDPATLLYTADGRPRVAILSIAHLGDAERMFFVSLLLHGIVAWMRRQPGTSSLRAIVYMDEIVGYFPPVVNPPSKAPLLTILKQGRAFGVAAVLATQNPVDLDYKGLGNAGTWFLGRLQTDRDKQRVLDGLEGAAAGGLPRAEADRLLSGLGKRVFLLHNVHERQPVLFQTRWALSYLRGPLSREQLRKLTERGVQGSWVQGSGVHGASRRLEGHAGDGPAARPIVPPGIQEFFVPSSAAGGVRYAPVMLGAARVSVTDAKLGVAEHRDVLFAAPIVDGPVPVDWAEARELDITAQDLEREPRQASTFGEVPAAALQAKRVGAWATALARHLGHSHLVELFRDPELKLTSHVGETERDFRIRVRDARHAARDEAVAALRKKYATKVSRAADQVRRAGAAVERESAQASQAKLQTGVSALATVLGALFGARRGGSLGRATTTARGMGRSMKEAGDIRRAEEALVAARAELAALEAEVEREVAAIADRLAGEPALDRIALAPKRGGVAVQFVALGWRPWSDA